MNWVTGLIATAISLLFILQGTSFLQRQERLVHVRCLGVLSILLGAFGFAAYVMFASGVLVLSPEYGVVMVQGTPAWIGLSLLLVGVPIGAGIGLHAGRAAAGLRARLLLILSVGAVIGVLAWFHLQKLNPSDPNWLRVRAHDLWWPPLLIWTAFCFVDCVLVSHKVTRLATRVWLGMLIPSGVALWALHRSHLHLQYADPDSLWLWKACLVVSLPILMGTSTWLFRPWVGEEGTRARRWGWVVGSALVGVMGLNGSLLWLEYPDMPWMFRPWFPWLVWLVVPAGVTSVRLYRKWKAGTWEIPDVGRPGRWDDALGLLALGALGYCASDLFYRERFNPLFDLIVLVLAWITLTEVVASGPLYAVFQRSFLQNVAAAKSRLKVIGAPMGTAVVQLGTLVVGFVKGFFTFSTWPSSIFKGLVFAMVLVALSEMPDAGKTVVRPFRTLGLSERESQDFGRMVSDRVVNLFGALAYDLRPEVSIMLPPSAKESAGLGLVASGEESDRLQAAVGNADIEIPGLKIPLSLLTAPIQSPMRKLLRIRVISGSVQRDGDGYILLANSSDGYAWQVRASSSAPPCMPEKAPKPAVPPPMKAPKSPAGVAQEPSATTPSENAPEPAPAVSADASAKPASGAGNPSPDTTCAIAGLAEELAYQLITSHPAMARSGMTQSWKAAKGFAKGLRAWRRYEQQGQDFEALQEATAQFQEAAKEDPHFALAHYRLGLALQPDGQPGAAAAAFRAAIGANPEFIAGNIALASQLYSLRSGYYARPASLDPFHGDDWLAQKPDPLEARRLWKQALRLGGAEAPVLVRASAYYGLCQQTMDPRPPEEEEASRPQLGQSYLAYFLCRRAAALYSTAPADLRSTPGVRADEGLMWNELGVILERSAQTRFDLTAERYQLGWHCSASSILMGGVSDSGEVTLRHLWQSPYSPAARKYYLRALALLPQDPVVLCNAAANAYVLGDFEPMQSLNALSATHLALADELSSMALGDAAYYSLAVAEYERAIQRQPNNVTALNNYAYAYWQWRSDALRHKLSPGPPSRYARTAEESARRAVQLAAGKASRTLEAQFRSTLGEVLMGQGRWHEASQVLTEAIKFTAPHAFFNEIHWDLAHAYFCALSTDQLANIQKSHEVDFKSAATGELDQIRKFEAGREQPPYSEQSSFLEPARLSKACPEGPESSTEDLPDKKKGPIYVLRGGQPDHDGYPICSRLGVVAYAPDSEEVHNRQLLLRVWGAAKDDLYPVIATQSAQPDEALLTLEPKNTHYLYFFRLELQDKDSDTTRPVSKTYPLETVAAVQGNPCAQNRIVLHFDRER